MPLIEPVYGARAMSEADHGSAPKCLHRLARSATLCRIGGREASPKVPLHWHESCIHCIAPRYRGPGARAAAKGARAAMSHSFDVVVIGGGPGGVRRRHPRRRSWGSGSPWWSRRKWAAPACTGAASRPRPTCAARRCCTRCASPGSSAWWPKAPTSTSPRSGARKDKIVSNLHKGIQGLLKKNGVDPLSGPGGPGAAVDLLAQRTGLRDGRRPAGAPGVQQDHRRHRLPAEDDGHPRGRHARDDVRRGPGPARAAGRR